ncbi:MAG: acyl-CoA thioesterase II, partial [Pseudomonadota bacterium]|nr:acyl-CoA thioesterase II [Pseudomonadota bacterium]
SFHVYFMLAGTVTDHLEFEVDRLRDGRSFCTRQVKAIQNGRAILTMICSFQQTEEGFEHQAAMPEVKGPDGIPSQVELARMFRDYFPEKVRDIYTADKPIEMRVLDPVNIFAPTKKDPVKYLWMKADGSLPEDTDLHAKLLAYASDFNLLPTSLHPHARSYGQKGMQMASLDHSVWFHRPFRMDEWLLYAIDSPNAGGGRGFCRGQVFNQKGELVASVAQEGLIRYREPEEKS